MNDELYFDYNASTPVDQRVLEEALKWMRESFANPSSSHPEGVRAAAAIALAKERIAAGIGGFAREVFFTSGGTEANNWALAGSARVAGRGHIVASSIEHKSVLGTLRDLERQGFEVSLVAPRPDGALRVEEIAAAIRDETRLVSIMAANNETGVIQPVESIGKLCRARGLRLHVDGVAALGKRELDVRAIGCDLLSLSSHKLYSMKGCGVLFVREGTALAPLIHGCGQQGGMRGGTENTAGAVGFGVAFERLREGAFGTPRTIGALRDQLLEQLEAQCSGLERNGSAECLPNTLNVSFPGADAASLVARLGARGFSVSAGAAGAGGATSHVLEAMGLGGKRARSSLRLSLGAHSTSQGIRLLVEAIEQALPVSQLAGSR